MISYSITSQGCQKHSKPVKLCIMHLCDSLGFTERKAIINSLHFLQQTSFEFIHKKMGLTTITKMSRKERTDRNKLVYQSRKHNLFKQRIRIQIVLFFWEFR